MDRPSDLPPSGAPGQQPSGPDLYQFSGDGHKAKPGNGPSQPGQGAPDLYQYGGDAHPQGQQPGQPGQGQPDLYGYSGDGQHHQGDNTGNDGSPPFGPNWHPDYTYSSPLAKQWLQDNKQHRGDALEHNPDGTYTVKFGDSLSTIAQRALQDSGHAHASKDEIKAEEQQIIKANDSHYKSLDHYPDQLKDGWKLQIPGAQQHGDRQCVPQHHRQDVPPPAGYENRPTVPQHNYEYYNNGAPQQPGQLSPQNRFYCQGPGGMQGAPESYYPYQGAQPQPFYNPNMQYQWQGPGEQGYYGPRGHIHPIPNYHPGMGRIMQIPNMIAGAMQAQLIGYNQDQQYI